MNLFPEKKSISKAEINELAIQAYDGDILCCSTPIAAEEAAQELLKESILGFDTETRPTFRKGEYYPPALLQLAGENYVVLFQIQQSKPLFKKHSYVFHKLTEFLKLIF